MSTILTSGQPPEPPDNAVEDAIGALRAFHVTDRETASMLIDLWARRVELTPAGVAAVLDRFDA